MIRITRFDDTAWRPLGPPKCDIQVLSDSPVSTVLGFRIGAGGCGPSLHFHAVDQVIIPTDRDITITLGDNTLELRPGDAVLVPAGLAHACANSGGETEQHIEAFIPPLAPDEPRFVTVVDHRDAPGSTREAVILCQPVQVVETDTHLVELPAAEASEVEIQVGQARIGLRARNSSATP